MYKREAENHRNTNRLLTVLVIFVVIVIVMPVPGRMLVPCWTMHCGRHLVWRIGVLRMHRIKCVLPECGRVYMLRLRGIKGALPECRRVGPLHGCRFESTWLVLRRKCPLSLRRSKRAR